VEPAIDIRMLPPDAGADPTVIELVTGLVNDVYAVAEEGLWVEGATTRTTASEVSDLVRAHEIAVARLDRRIVGAVRVRQLDATTGEFGMLAAHPAHRGLGIGGGLLRFAEQRSRGAGLRAMQLELLVPRGWAHPAKEFLAGWYTRLGYALSRTGRIEEAYPALGPLLATPCDLRIYRKELRPPPCQLDGAAT